MYKTPSNKSFLNRTDTPNKTRNLIHSNSSVYNKSPEMFIKSDFSRDEEVSFFNNFSNQKEKEMIENLNSYIHQNTNTDNYEVMNETTSTTTNRKIYSNTAIYTDINTKNKIMNINSSLKSFNVKLKSRAINYSEFENNRNKNVFINQLLDYIIDFIGITKQESENKINLLEKVNSFNKKFEDQEKKIKKLQEDLVNSKRHLENVVQKNHNKMQLQKEEEIFNINNNRKGSTSINGNFNNENDIGFIKAQNRKLNLQIITLKNENKKREIEFSKLQEKLKKLLNEKLNNNTISAERFYNNNNIAGNGNSSYSINTFNPNLTKINNNNNNNENCKKNTMTTTIKFNNNFPNDIFKITNLLENDLFNNSFNNNNNKFSDTKMDKKQIEIFQLRNVYQNFLDFNINKSNEKQRTNLIHQNTFLMNILFRFQETLDEINKKVIIFNNNNSKINEEMHQLIKLKEVIFSMHLIDRELLKEFTDNFIDNINKFEDNVLRIIDLIFNENNQIKEKYVILERDLIKTKMSRNNTGTGHRKSNSLIMSKENYNSKESNFSELNFSIGNNNNNNKDMLKNFKRWSVNNNSKKSLIPLPNPIRGGGSMMIRNSSSFVGNINNLNDNSIHNKSLNESINSLGLNKLRRLSKNQSFSDTNNNK